MESNQRVTDILVHRQTLPILNLSFYLHQFKPVRQLIVDNKSKEEQHELVVTIKSDIPCIEPFEHPISRIQAESNVEVPLEQLQVTREYLNKLSETEQALITIEVKQNELILVRDQFSILVHPIEQFGGFHVMPELIASYITPNHPYVYHIKRKAADILDRQGLPVSFDGYQRGDPERVLQVMSAIYSAIQSEDIIYSSLPPGYEETGQRLRLLNTIQQEKFGNCIDISLLFAACLEAVDLHPILIIISGHAFIGCWLVNEKFPEVINDDKAAITKRLSKGIREMAAVEATTVCKGAQVSFSEALHTGEAQLVEREHFVLSVDIKRARTLRIRPLPLLVDSGVARIADDYYEPDTTMERRFDLGTIYQDETAQVSGPKTKQKIWQRKLLDLSLRNNLLSLRLSRNTLQFVDIDISHLEDTLSEGRSFTIMPHPNAEVRRKYNEFMMPVHASSVLFQLANDELKHNRLTTYYHQQDLDHVLTFIHKNARQAIEENGSSTLYLAVGLLKWFDRKTPDLPRYAPVLLLPVEISRRSVNSKFILRSREEDTMINITLLEFLRQEYELNLGALEQLPTDEKGVDVAKVMGMLRRAVMQLKGWDVEEQLVLGNFSFSKLILWKDLVDHEDRLLESSMVQSLVTGKLGFEAYSDALESVDYDQIPAQAMALPISTDVSQMEAVLAAQRGQSFILHGPPGTGKSQTITNIIADALFRGKRVLFVAAKKAALDVVHNRLEKIGLAPFTLELHSNKSKKSDVLNQLANAVGTQLPGRQKDFALEAQRLDNAKKAISDYVSALHQKHPIGWTLYDSIVAIDQYSGHSFPRTALPDQIMQRLDAARWQQWCDWLPQFQAVTKTITHPSDNGLAALHIAQYSPDLAETIRRDAAHVLDIIPKAIEHSRKLAAAIHITFPTDSFADWHFFLKTVQLMQDLPDMPLSLVMYLASKDQYSIFEDWIAAMQLYQSALAEILKHYNRQILQADIPALEIRWKRAQQSWFIPRWFQSKTVKKEINLYRIQPTKDDADVNRLFAAFHQWQEAKLRLERSQFSNIQAILTTLYKADQTDVAVLQAMATAVQKWNDHINQWQHQGLETWLRMIGDRNAHSVDALRQPAATVLQSFLQTARMLTDATVQLASVSGIRMPQDKQWLHETELLVKGVQAYLPELKNWMNYALLCEQAERLEATWLVRAYEGNVCNTENMESYFHFRVHASVIQQVVARSEALSLFNTDLFEKKIAQYKQIAREFQDITRQELQIRLASKLPNAAIEAAQSSELGVLQRAIKSKGRGMSIRKLFDQLPNLLPRVAPCMLMSPISVAQYFDANVNHFDILIFDEASQLPTCEAISALARAKQAIIVGDPKQMPPTSFFSISRTDDEEIEVEDLESILDDCLSLSMPSRYLLRHYRSKHESLIAFSNTHYYDDKLLTFPSADDLNRKVRYHHVPGHYDKGKTRTNKFEAEAIVAYISAHYKDPDKRMRSVGVVTFSQTQQTLIENLLEQVYAADTQLEELVTASEEPLFIKNLENVQGDERDIILFSICYAPDETGKMSMNFGPLNRDGGWRRLNVAVTRARYEMHVFATLKADEINTARTSAEGVAGLKGFLQFAQKGLLSRREDVITSERNRRTLAELLAIRLREHGMTVKCDIGTSKFKIDLGIVHPSHPDQYILGVLIDGRYFYDARTANDRELVMPAVLSSLGWQIARVWTMDWAERPDAVVKAIVDRVGELEKQPSSMPLPENVKPVVVNERDNPLRAIPPGATTRPSKQRPYLVEKLAVIPHATGDAVFEARHRNQLKQQIQAVVNKEAPISKSLLFRKVLQAWNISRIGAKLDKYLEALTSEMQLPKTIHHQPFFWQELPASPLLFYRDNETEKRAVEDIAPEELAAALYDLVTQHFSIEEGELIRYLARTFGYAKVGRQIENLLRYAVNLAEQQGLVTRVNDRIAVAKTSPQ